MARIVVDAFEREQRKEDLHVISLCGAHHLAEIVEEALRERLELAVGVVVLVDLVGVVMDPDAGRVGARLAVSLEGVIEGGFGVAIDAVVVATVDPRQVEAVDEAGE